MDIINADCLDTRLIESESIDLTITSPPYNISMDYNSNDDNMTYGDYLLFTEKWLKNVYTWTKHTGRLCVNIAVDKNKNGKQSIASDVLQIAKEIDWRYRHTIIWCKQKISKRTAWGSWMSASAPCITTPAELIIVFYKNEWKKSHKRESDMTRDEFLLWTNGIWKFNEESAKRIGHPAPYPPQLPYRCVKLFSYKGDTILDPFLGSGTTAVVAKELERKYKGIEIDTEYCNLANKRIKNVEK